MNTSRAVVLAGALSLGVGVIFGWNLLWAQSSPSDRLSEVIVLLAQGQPREAAELIDGIGANDRDFYVAQCYKALCFYALGDKKGFWKTLDPMPVRNAIPAEIKEDVWVKQMDAFLHFGKFESLVRKISEFEESYPTSVRTAQAQEYRLAGLFEKGRKIARDAFRATDDSGFNSHWSVAETNLQQFLALAVSRANYTELPGRSLREDVWVARILLGDEALFEEVQDRAGREKLSLLRLELAVDLERESVDTNLRRLVDFLDEFPEPAERERLERAAAVLYFRKGRQLAMNGELALARDYFEAQRAIADRDAAMLEDRFYSHLLEGDFRTLESLTAAAIEQSEPGGVEWIQAKLFDAFGSLNQTRTNEAAAVLDELIVAAETFKDDKPHDRLLINAVKWRIHLALSGGDPARAESLARWVQRSDCPKHYKLPFLRDHVGLLPTQPWEGGAR